jgi:hypothetical protein
VPGGFFADSAAQGVQLICVGAGSIDWCGLDVLQGALPPLAELTFIYEGYFDNPAGHDVKPPRSINLRAGPAHVYRGWSSIDGDCLPVSGGRPSIP